MGMSHSGSVTADGVGTVNLTEGEVSRLVDLIRQKDTADVDALDLANVCPEIYEKLDDAYRDLAYSIAERHWLWEGFYSGAFEYDPYELMEYCEESCGFEYMSLEEYLEQNEDADEDGYDEEKCDEFFEWLDDYLRSLDESDAVTFFYEHMNASLDIETEFLVYTVAIPQEIVMMASR